jgi:thiol-disulfide isomerase/thioredoxin
MKYLTKNTVLSLSVLLLSAYTFAQAPAKVIVTMTGALCNKVYIELMINNKVSFDSLILTKGTGTKELVIDKPTAIKLFDHYSANMVLEMRKQGKKVDFTLNAEPKGVKINDEAHDQLRNALLEMKYGYSEDHAELVIRPAESLQFSTKAGALSVATIKGKEDAVNYSLLEQKLAFLKDKHSEIERNINFYPDKVDAAVYAKFDDQITENRSKIHQLAFEFIKNNAASEYAPKVALSYLSVEQEYMQQLPRIIPELYLNQPMSSLKRCINMFSKVNVGTEIPAFTAQDITGKPVKFSDYKGTVILVDFWASWCTPCRAENPYMRYIYNRYHSKGLEIIAFSVDDKLDAWKKAVLEDGLTWPQVSDLKGYKDGASKDFSLSGVPTNFLVKDGKVIGVFLRRQTLNAMLQKELVN